MFEAVRHATTDKELRNDCGGADSIDVTILEQDNHTRNLKVIRVALNKVSQALHCGSLNDQIGVAAPESLINYYQFQHKVPSQLVWAAS